MERGVAALCGVIAILLTGCSTIVKGTQQQVSVATPGVRHAFVSCRRHARRADTWNHRPTQEQTRRRSELRQAVLHHRRRRARVGDRDHDGGQCPVRWCYRPGDRCCVRRHEQISTWGRNRHESDPQLRGAEKGAGRAHGKHSSASTRTTQLTPHIELPIPRLLG